MNINKELKFLLPVNQLRLLNKLLCETTPGSTVSISFLSFESDIEIDITELFLTRLANDSLLKTLIVIECDNEDSEKAHKFTFNSTKELYTFMKQHEKECPECSSELDVDNSFVFFKTKPFNKVELIK